MTASSLFEKARAYLGWSGLTGLLLIVFGWSAEYAVRQPAAERLAQMRIHARAADQQSGLASSAELEHFYRYFQRDKDLTEWLRVFYATAEKRGVDLKAADYQLTADPTLALQVYRIHVPLAGNYSNIRAFAESILADIPVASLDTFRLSRKSVQSSVVDAELSFSLYVPR